MALFSYFYIYLFSNLFSFERHIHHTQLKNNKCRSLAYITAQVRLQIPITMLVVTTIPKFCLKKELALPITNRMQYNWITYIHGDDQDFSKPSKIISTLSIYVLLNARAHFYAAFGHSPITMSQYYTKSSVITADLKLGINVFCTHHTDIHSGVMSL